MGILKDHPEVLNQTIEKPIIITGYMRSGTTWLQHILTQAYGKAVRHIPFWESLGGGIEVDPQRPGSAMNYAKFQMDGVSLFPSIFAIHEVNALDQPEEEIGWTELTFRGFLNALHIQHTHLENLVVEPSSAHLRYRLLKVMMQIKQWQEGPQRWVLKSPEHLTGVNELAEAFPDAKVVTIHRDNVSV